MPGEVIGGTPHVVTYVFPDAQCAYRALLVLRQTGLGARADVLKLQRFNRLPTEEGRSKRIQTGVSTVWARRSMRQKGPWTIQELLAHMAWMASQREEPA